MGTEVVAMTELIDERDIENIKGMTDEWLERRFGITNARKQFRCIFPDHDDRNPSCCYYPDSQTIFCHACRRGGDVFTVKGIVDGIEGFPEQVRGVADDLGYRLSDVGGPPKPRPKRKKRPPFDVPREAGGDDCSEACGEAFANLYLPENVEMRRYLFRRGLDDRDIARWGLGCVDDPKKICPQFRVKEEGALGFITIPFWNTDFTEARYCMVRTVSAGKVRNKEWRPAGMTSPLWNEWMLTASLDEVLVAEGLIDAMALRKLTERDGREKHCMALGGVGGAKRLVQVLYHAKPEKRPGLVVICMDQDEVGKETRDKLSADLCKIKVPHICVPAYPGGAKDADEWLMAGRGTEWEFCELPSSLDGAPKLYGTRWLDG